MLNKSGDKHLRMSGLADAALLTRSGMTRLVDRLERQGLVRANAVRQTDEAPTR